MKPATTVRNVLTVCALSALPQWGGVEVARAGGPLAPVPTLAPASGLGVFFMNETRTSAVGPEF